MTESKTDTTTEALDAEAKKKHGEKDEERLMCRHGFHDWITKEGETLDDAGKPIDMLKCSRCGKEKPAHSE